MLPEKPPVFFSSAELPAKARVALPPKLNSELGGICAAGFELEPKLNVGPDAAEFCAPKFSELLEDVAGLWFGPPVKAKPVLCVLFSWPNAKPAEVPLLKSPAPPFDWNKSPLAMAELSAAAIGGLLRACGVNIVLGGRAEPPPGRRVEMIL